MTKLELENFYKKIDYIKNLLSYYKDGLTGEEIESNLPNYMKYNYQRALLRLSNIGQISMTKDNKFVLNT